MFCDGIGGRDEAKWHLWKFGYNHAEAYAYYDAIDTDGDEKISYNDYCMYMHGGDAYQCSQVTKPACY